MAVGGPFSPPPPLEDGTRQHLYSHKSLCPSNPNLPISYSDMVKGQPGADSPIPDSFPLKIVSDFQGKPSVAFSLAEKSALIARMKFVLIGKFSHGRPPMNTIQGFFAGLKLQGRVSLSLLDSKHIVIECIQKSDYVRIWLQLIWTIKGYQMRVFKWDDDFDPFKESPIAPVWITIEGLPIYMFDAKTLMSISNSIGCPLKVDPRNIARTNLYSARICVELDVSKPLVDAIFVRFEDEGSNKVVGGFWASVSYEVIPLFCSSCFHIGHGSAGCKRKSIVSMGAMQVHGQKVFENLSQPVLDGAIKVLDEMPQPDSVAVRVVHDDLPQSNSGSHVKEAAISQAWLVKGPKGEVSHEHSMQGADIVIFGGSSEEANQGKQVATFGSSGHVPCASLNSFSPLLHLNETLQQEGHVAAECTGGGEASVAAIVKADPKAGGAQPTQGQVGRPVAALVGSLGKGAQLPVSSCHATELGRNTVVKAATVAGNILITEEQQNKQGALIGMAAEVVSPMHQVLDKVPPAGLQDSSSDSRDVGGVDEADKKASHNVEVVRLQSRTPQPSWADLVAQEEIRVISNLKVAEAADYARQQIAMIMEDNSVDGYETPIKSCSKAFTTDLPDLQLDPMLVPATGGDATRMSKVLEDNFMLVARRSVSPKGRSSQKLKSLRHKVDTLDLLEAKATVVDREDYSELGHELRRGDIIFDLSY